MFVLDNKMSTDTKGKKIEAAHMIAVKTGWIMYLDEPETDRCEW